MHNEKLEISQEELEIRQHLKKLTYEDLADSVYLFSINFNTDSLDNIFDSIMALYQNVKVLKEMVDSNFKSTDGVKVLMPSSRETQSVVIQDYVRKEFVLEKVLANKTVKSVFFKILSELEREEAAKKERYEQIKDHFRKIWSDEIAIETGLFSRDIEPFSTDELLQGAINLFYEMTSLSSSPSKDSESNKNELARKEATFKKIISNKIVAEELRKSLAELIIEKSHRQSK